MKLNRPTKNQFLLFFVLFIGSFFASNAQEYVPFSPRLDGGNIEIRGDVIFVGNNILNRASQADSTQANNPYNGNDNNNSLWMEYIDIDGVVDLDGDGDDDTFSSSSAELNVADPACSQVRYAGLYWAGTYPNERSTNGSQPFSGTPRNDDWNEIKFRVPGGTYVDLIADDSADPVGEEDDIITNGYQPANPTTFIKDAPVICYKNVTDLVRSNTDPNGSYTVANVNATRGRRNGSSSAGWVMVIIYENPNESGKYISTFDGYAGMSGSAGNIEVPINGFRTLPTPFPVRARIGVAALEGDRRIRNDRFFIRSETDRLAGNGFTNLSTGQNPANNFFNSTITSNGNQVPTRTPYGTNTLGTDIDLFNLNNPSNSVIQNGESAATLRFTSTGDGYGSFLAAFAVEIIEPNIVLEKRVQNIAGNDITDQGVNLGQTLDYVLSFRNLGNDDAVNYTIRDLLPVNTTYTSFDISGAPGVTANIDATTNEVTFSIPDNLVEIGDPVYEIRLRVEVASNCFDFVDACSNQITNLAYSTYQGSINSAVITDDPSVSDFDNCGFVTPGATNFLLDDLNACNFSRTVQLCGDFAVLDAGDGFDSYVWYSDDNNNGQIDGSDTVLNDGDPDSDPSTLVVNNIGTYIVDKIIPAPCIGFQEIITVERFGATQTNPIVDYFNDVNSDADPTNDIQGEIVTCSEDGDLLPRIFLCGTNDSQLMQVNITDAQSLSWEKLDEGSCTAAPDGCANKNLGCSWIPVGSGNNYTADTEGKYRLVINYSGGCPSQFYFDVFQNNLDIEFNRRDIICDRDGRIRITNLGSNYGYQLIDHANSTILTPFSAGQGPIFNFGSGENGSYRVEVVQLDGSGNPIPGACIFSTDPIGIRDRNFQVDIDTTPANCNAQGTIEIDVLNVRADYTYVLRRSDGTLIDDETAKADNTHTFTVNSGDYIIEVTTQDGCSDSQDITVGRTPDPTLSAVTTANIGCTAGTIELTRTGGQGNPDFLYAIWSGNGMDRYTDIASIPADAYQIDSTFYFGWRDDDGDGDDEYIPGDNGTYEFIIIDANNCSAISNPVTISDVGPTTIDSIDETQPSCSGENDGALTINVSGGIPPYEYSIDNGTNYQDTPNFINLTAGTYNIRVLDASGCDITQSYILSEPFPLSASAGVSRDATCDPNGAEVRITNVVGGNPPYEYSFDGGATYGASTIAVLPPGDYTVIVRDSSCEFPMAVTVEDVPDEPEVTLTPEVSYLCDGSAVVTATPNISTYNYTFSLDGVPNSPDPTNNVFENVPPGTYTVSTNYVSQTPPTPSLLLSEDFGYGNTIPNPNTSGYFYENQQDDSTPSGAPIDRNRAINDYEYAVTSNIERPFGAWLNPTDHTSGDKSTQGRYLVINIGAPSPGQIIYQKPINDIIHNQPIEVSIWLINLLRSGRNGVEPDLTIELRDPGSGAVVTSSNTGAVPENNNWNEYVLSLNPGANSTLDLVITTNESEINGNDVAIDDITVFQTPEVCELTVETAVSVVAGNLFTASVTGSTNVSCNGQSDATITFEVENFDATSGFDYSLDGGTTWTNSTSPTVTTTAPIAAGTQRVDLRKADEVTCTTFVNQTITQPSAIVADADITTELNCTNGGATITASASGGTPGYEYQLEDDAGTIITGFDFVANGNNTVFAPLPAGNYIVRVRDNNACEDVIDAALTVNDFTPLAFDYDETNCYSGSNDATIQVNVTAGNGDYQFRINGGTYVTPTPANATSHTFTNLASGTYTIQVLDGSGCTETSLPFDIEPPLTVSASAPKISACTTDTDITISAAGGDGNYTYAVVNSGTPVTVSDFGAPNPFTVSTPGNYEIYVRDKNGATDFCETMYPMTIIKDAPIDITATPTDVSCFNATDGSISITVDSGGNGPFRYRINGSATYVTGSNFPNLAAGTYPVQVIDASGCETVPEDVIVGQPMLLNANTEISLPYTCTQLGEITVGNTTLEGGSGDYQFSINGGAWTALTTTAHTFTDLTDDTYSIRMRDANATSCEITLADVIIDALPTEPTLARSITYNCDGSGNITITPFDASYTYILDGAMPGQSGAPDSNVFSRVAVGSHTITVDYGRDCTTDINVIVADGNAFEASITASENLDCNGGGSGTITIDADNYNTGGYEYSLDGGTTFVGPFTAAHQISGLSAQAYSIEVRDVDNAIASLPGCTVPLNRTLTEPAVLAVSAAVSPQITCDNGATITATGSGGTGPYIYQLEDDSAAIITGFDFTTNGNNNVFSNISVAGDYIVRIQDANTCETVSTAVTATAPDAIVFDLTPTDCYSGANDGEILVNVTAGNGGYQFRIDGGPWRNPATATPGEYTFTGLSDGTYSIEVQDQFGCPVGSNAQVETINPQLIVDVDVVDLSACNDGSITVSATGGNGTLQYAFVPANSSPVPGDFTATATFTVTETMATANPAGFDVHIQDNSGAPAICTYLEEDIVFTPIPTLTATATATDPECFNGLGAIGATAGGGTAPYDYTLTDLSPADGIDYGRSSTNIVSTTLPFAGIGVGDYEVTITDSNGCTITSSITTINNATEITADIDPALPPTCNDPDTTQYGFDFNSVVTPTSGGSETVEYSADGGSTWQASNALRGYVSGTEVFPSIRVTLATGTICQRDFNRYIIPFPLDNLDISISAVVVDCNDLQVRVQGTAGVAPYEYTFSEDPANFNPATATWQPGTTTASDGSTVPAGHGQYVWMGLTPGRTYVFYVRDDTGCVRQSLVNVNDLITEPLEVTYAETPTCFGATSGAVEFTLNPGAAHPEMRWEIYELGNATPILVSGGGASAINVPYNNTISTGSILGEGDYYIEVVQVDSGGSDACFGGSENAYVNELAPLSATATATRDISCNLPGLITVESISGGGGAPYTYDVTGPAGFTALAGTTDNPVQIPVNSPAGSYTVTLHDQYGCSVTLNAVTLDLSPNPTITVQQDNCAAPIIVTAAGVSAAGNLRYTMVGTGDPAPTPASYVDNGGVFDNVAPGSYDVYVIDGNGCSALETAFVVHPVLQATASQTKLLDCSATPDAQITIEVTAGSGSYDYQITDGTGTVVTRAALPSNPYVFNTTVPEDYIITVYDNGTSTPECNRAFPMTVDPAILPDFIETHQDVTCNGASDGSITLTETNNGTNPLTYSISPSAGSFNAATSTFEDLPTGTYTVTGTGTNGCTRDVANIFIDTPTIIGVPTPTVVEFRCTTGNNQIDATITIDDTSLSGGSGNYVRYEFIDDQGTAATGDDVVEQNGTNTEYTETDLAGGSYTINVYDDNGCVGSTTATILPYVEISNATVTVDSEITCNPGDDAEVSIGVTTDPVAGATTLEYSVVGTDNIYSSLNQTVNTFTALGIGNYEVTVTNTDTGCFVQTTFEIEDPNTFEIDTAVVDVVCFGDDGTVSFTINDPAKPYSGGFTYQIFDSQGTPAIGDDVLVSGTPIASANVGPTTPYAIGAGEYRVEITQDSDPSCVASEFFTVAGPSADITADTDVDPITCVGNDGVIEIIDVLGGWGGYEYYVGTVSPASATAFGTNRRFENLIAGTYQAWVVDQEGCQREVQNGIVLADPTAINASLEITQPNCTNFTGEIEVTDGTGTPGATGGQGSNYSYQLIKDGTPVGAVQNTTTFSGLDAGDYEVQITDQWTCTFTTAPVTLYEPIVPATSVVKAIDCSATDRDGQITVTQSGGSGNFDYFVTYPDGFTNATNTTGVFVGFNQVGDYEFTIVDQTVGHACSTQIIQNLQDRIFPVLSVDNSTNVTCNGADDGTVSVSVTDNGVGPYTFIITSGPGSSTTFPMAATSATNTSAVFEGLEGSIGGITYTIEARGANNCEVIDTVTITELDAITVDPIDIVQYGCTNGNNSNRASISFAAASGGTNTFVRYVFFRDGVEVQDDTTPTHFETDGLGGDYEIRVYDDAGCFATSAADTLLPFVEISDATVTTTQEAACSPLNNAEIEVGVTVSPSATTPDLQYVVTGINVTYSQTITSTNNPQAFTGLEFGNYRISITNVDTGCVIDTVHNIDNPNTIEVTATKLTDEECLNNGIDDGSFEIAIADYAGDYSFQVYDNNDVPVPGTQFSGTGNTGTPLPPISGLSGGVYYVRVTATDAPACDDDSNYFTINTPADAITAIVREEANVTCSNDQGKILVDPDGGQGPYTIRLADRVTDVEIDIVTGVSAHIFEGLSAQDIHVTVTDALGCEESYDILLIEPQPIVPTITATTLNCFNDGNAEITTTIGARTNPTAPIYEFQLWSYGDDPANTPRESAFQSTPNFTGLSAGFYRVFVRDNVSCSEESNLVEIINPTEVEASLRRTSPLTCDTGVEFELSATGGSGTYEYRREGDTTWIPMAGNSVSLPESAVRLGADTYQYEVRDAVGCAPVLSNSIEEDVIEDLDLTVDETAAFIACFNESTAIIYAEATGGLGDYRFSLYENSVSPANLIEGPQPDGEFDNLPAGTYWVTVTSDDCETAPERVVITQPDELLVVNPDDFTNVTCEGANDGTITVEMTGGTAPYQYAISPNLNQADDENVFEDLAPGTYTVIASDRNGCFEFLEYTITEPEALDVAATALPEVCTGEENGSIELTIEGGTAPYITRLSSETNYVQDRTTLSGLASGSYIIFVRDANDCEENVSVVIDPGVNLNAVVEPVYGCEDNIPSNYVNIVLKNQNLTDEVLYALDSEDAADMQLNPFFRDIAPGQHYIAISHANGCIVTHEFEIENYEPLRITVEQSNINELTATVSGGREDYTIYFGDDNNGSDNTYRINRTDTYVVTVVDENGCEASANLFIEFIDIEIPNFFTPNGDGENQTWQPRNTEGFPEILTIVFDRYGREVYRIGPGGRGWDGFYQQTELPSGDYWYIIKLNGENDDREFVGHFTLYR